MALSPIPSSSSDYSSGDEEELREAMSRHDQFQQRVENAMEASTSTFVPPKGMKRAVGDETLTEFSSEVIKQKLDNGCQLWAVRLPSNLNKLRYLNDIKISIPDHADSSKSQGSEKVADFSHKKLDYEIYSLTDNIADVSAVGAGEMRNMTALVANKRKKYTPFTIQRHLVIKQAVAFPPFSLSTHHEPGAKHQQPEGLDGFFRPSGFDTILPEHRTKRARVETAVEETTSIPAHQDHAHSAFDSTMDTDGLDSSQLEPGLSKEERKRLKAERKEARREKHQRKEEKRRRKSEAAAAAAAVA